MMLNTGDKHKFTYPQEFQLYPDYKAHSGQTVEIVRELVDGVDYGPMDIPSGHDFKRHLKPIP